MALHRILARVFLGLSLGSPAAAQTRLWTVDGAGALDLLGWSVAEVGDVDGDGLTDFACGAWQAAPGAAGYVRLYAGADGAVLLHAAGGVPGGRFGWSVGRLTDRDTDGAPDLLVGAPREAFGGVDSGSAHLFSSASGASLLRIDGDDAGDRFGFSVANAGDIDGDGTDDYAIGAPGDDDGGSGAGSVRVYSGASDALILRFDGAANDALGHSVGAAGDVDGDGRADLVAGARQIGGPGYARVWSGATGLELYTVCGDDDGDEFGFSVAAAGDVDGDGLGDVLVGAPSDDPIMNGLRPGTINVYVGPAGTFLRNHVGHNDDALGTSVTGVGDVDGDGLDDYASGARHDDLDWHTGRVEVRSGASGALLHVVYGDHDDNFFGAAVAGAPHVGPSAGPGFLAGAFREDSNGGESGRAALFTGRCLAPIRYCEGAPNSAGPGARIGTGGSFAHADNALTLFARGAPAGQFGIFVYARSADQLPLGDGYLCLQAAPVGLFRVLPAVPIDAAGLATHAFDLSASPAASGAGHIAAGTQWCFQFWYRDPAGPGGSGFNLSDATRVTFCR